MSRQTELAYHFVKEKILNDTFKPSQKLIESELSELIGVSRNTVKKALLKLEQENLVKIENNKGATIKSYTLDEVMNYLEIQEVLEGLVAKMSAISIRDEELQKLEQILLQMEAALKNNKLDEYSDLNKEFHHIIYSASKNAQAVEMINMIKTQLLRFHFRTILVSGRNEQSMKEHTRIFEALKSRDAHLAEEAVKSHIANVRETVEKNFSYLI
ncbi:GntR family transcriptional regulator [Ferviditalea candida]|uniref:GntR family transcriptional regulator n=1 Tax=Ferviditalea candida TaxID=3108399 RepID=A0ABU5ZMU9_9BACL|nr:GntR family transcriptional regulator [Paenibacillaceae bacterium T2]